MTVKVALTSIFVNDPSEAFRFYTEVLGFQEKLFDPESQLAMVVAPEDPDGTILLLESDEDPAAKAFQEAIYAQGLPMMTLSVDDIQWEYERLCGLGVAFRKAPTRHEWGIEAVLDDTCGNFVQIAQIA